MEWVAVKGQPLVTKILPSRVLRIANLELIEKTSLKLKMDPEK